MRALIRKKHSIPDGMEFDGSLTRTHFRVEWEYYTVDAFPGPAGIRMPDTHEFVAWVPENKTS